MPVTRRGRDARRQQGMQSPSSGMDKSAQQGSSSKGSNNASKGFAAPKNHGEETRRSGPTQRKAQQENNPRVGETHMTNYFHFYGGSYSAKVECGFRRVEGSEQLAPYTDTNINDGNLQYHHGDYRRK